MTKFLIEYNPYLTECIFKRNSENLGDNTKIGAKSKQRLQVLLGKLGNWKGLLEEIVIACDDDEIELSFKGRKIDYDDLEYAINLYDTSKNNDKVKFILQPCEESRNESDIIGELDKIINEIKEKNIPEFKKKNKAGKDVLDLYQEIKNGIFEVSVIATMSSGKSTLINSLLHTELLPSSNEACTATITRILDNVSMTQYEAECYDANKNIVHLRERVSLDKLKIYNAEEKVKYIDIEGNIPAISGNDIRLRLRDTPGPNNSQNEEHGELTRTVIRQTNSLVLYVMNVTQFEITDDNELLKEISYEMKMAGKQSRDRFVFIINKCDCLDEEKGETPDKILEKATEYLKKFEIIDPILIPTSARTALLIQKKKNGEELSRQEKKDVSEESIKDWNNVEELHYEKYAVALSPTVRSKLNEQVKKYREEGDTEAEAWIHTGIPILEETICEYIDKYAYPIKINDAVKDIVSILDELNMKERFKKKISKGEIDLENIGKQIKESKKKLENGDDTYRDYKKKIDGISVDFSAEEKQQKMEVDKKLNDLTIKYNNMKKVDKGEADRIVSDFEEKLKKYQGECENNLNYQIEDKVFKKGNDMLQEYTQKVNEIMNGLVVDGYDFKALHSFKRYQIANLEEIKKRNEEIRYRKELVWMDNPERVGFWGKFKFWKPKRISFTRDVKDGIDIDIKKVIVDIMNGFSKNIKDNIRGLFKQATEEMEKYKMVFNENIDNLQNELKETLEKLGDETQNYEEISKEMERNKELSDWMAKQDEKIRSILIL